MDIAANQKDVEWFKPEFELRAPRSHFESTRYESSRRAGKEIQGLPEKIETPRDPPFEIQQLKDQLNASDTRLQVLESIHRDTLAAYKNNLELLATHQKENRALTGTEIFIVEISLEAAKDAQNHQQSTIVQLTSMVSSQAKNIESLGIRLEQSTSNNVIIMQKAEELEQEIMRSNEKNIKLVREKQSIDRWIVTYKSAVDDYECCVREIGIFETGLTVAAGDVTLSNHIKRIMRNMNGISRFIVEFQNSSKKHELDLRNFKSDSQRANQRQILEMERHQADLASSIIDKEDAMSRKSTAEREAERMHSISKRSSEESKKAKQMLADYEKNATETVLELTIKCKNQIRSAREDFDVEREGLRSQIEILRMAKVDLQVEVSQLIRDRRCRSFDKFK